MYHWKSLSTRWLVWLGIVSILAGCPIVTTTTEVQTPPSPIAETPDNTQAPNVSPPNQATAEMENSIREEINQIRQRNNLNALEHNEELARVAREYSRRMAQEGFFSHTGPQGDTPDSRVRQAGISYQILGENLSMNRNVPNPEQTAVEGWMNSPGHRENILRPPFTQTGVGVWREGDSYYFTQLFMS